MYLLTFTHQALGTKVFAAADSLHDPNQIYVRNRASEHGRKVMKTINKQPFGDKLLEGSCGVERREDR